MKRFGLLLVILLMAVVCPPAHAADKDKGLFITPLRQFITVEPSKSQTATLTVGNFTQSPITVTMSFEQFSVADYSYDYLFWQARDNWISFDAPQFELQPGKSRAVTYTIAPPISAMPGGHYFTIFATTSLNGRDLVRAASVVYATASGQLTKTAELTGSTIPRVSFGGDIPYSLTVKDTGNTHYATYTSGRLQGLMYDGKGQTTTNLLLPGTARTLAGSIPSPILPGIYHATFGFTTDTNTAIEQTRSIVFIPPWAIVLPIGIAWLTLILLRRRKQ